jgi:disulfide oxidoreductase YuzD
MPRNFDLDGWLDAAYEERFEMDDPFQDEYIDYLDEDPAELEDQ